MNNTKKDKFNELAVFKKIAAKGINAMYMFEWLNDDRQIVMGSPDGLMKDIILPVDEERYERFLKLKKHLWDDRVFFKYYPDTEIFFSNEGKIFGKARFRIIVITLFLKDLVDFLYALKCEGLLTSGKILRAVIVDAGKGDPSIARKYTGEPEKGYDEFWVGGAM